MCFPAKLAHPRHTIKVSARFGRVFNKFLIGSRVKPTPKYTLGFLIHGFWAGWTSSIFGGLGGPGGLKTMPEGSPPQLLEWFLGAAGAAQNLHNRRFPARLVSGIPGARTHLGFGYFGIPLLGP